MTDTRTEAQIAVKVAEEFDKLDTLTQQSFELAVELIKKSRKLTEEEEKEEKENGVQEQGLHGQT